VPVGGDCATGTAAVTTWRDEDGSQAGSLACVSTSTEQPLLVWTEDRFAVVGIALAEGKGLDELYAWWLAQPSMGG
jgi:hypothetical protein